jgi:hypothetical protein
VARRPPCQATEDGEAQCLVAWKPWIVRVGRPPIGPQLRIGAGGRRSYKVGRRFVRLASGDTPLRPAIVEDGAEES